MSIKEIAQAVLGTLFIWIVLVLVYTAGSL